MKIVVLTNGSSHGIEIIRQLRNKKINLECIILEDKTLGKKELATLMAKLGKASFIVPFIPFKNFIYHVFRKLKYKDVSAKSLKPYSKAVYNVKNFNGSQCEEILNSVKPDLIILAGSRIIKENILSIPKIGTLNAHPGLLPYYRGVDVIKWALYNNDNVGVTIHFVNSGIDSGAICKQEELQFDANTSIHNIKQNAIEVAGRLMATVVSEIVENGSIATFPNNLDVGTYYSSMPREKSDELYHKRIIK